MSGAIRVTIGSEPVDAHRGIELAKGGVEPGSAAEHRGFACQQPRAHLLLPGTSAAVTSPEPRSSASARATCAARSAGRPSSAVEG